MARNKYSWRERFYSFLISVLCICAAVLVVAIVIDSKLGGDEDVTVQPVVTEAQATPQPLTLRVATAVPTQAPEGTPVPTEEPEATEPPFEFLPVYKKVETEEKVIAITMDDCSHQANVRMAAVAAQNLGAKLTLFPIGKSVMEKGMSEILRTCVFDLGFEVENRSWSNGQLHRISETDLASEIWTADIAVDYVLEKDYDMHFFRPRGGLGTRDARTHSYLKQLGYDGIVTWSVAATEMDLDTLTNKLAPGNIYLFSSSRSDVEKLVPFMQYASERGYRMVTLNELLGYEANAVAEQSGDVLSQTMPLLQNYEPVRLSYKIGERAWQIFLIQDRLAALGYLPADGVDGVYGEGTSSAISAFQVNCGLMGTGVATTETQNRLFAEDAPRVG